MEYNILSCGAVADGRDKLRNCYPKRCGYGLGGRRRACHHPGRAVSEWVGIAER